MGKSGCSVSVDLSKIEKKFDEVTLRAKQAAFAKRVALDMRKHVPVDEGTLRDSEPISSDYSNGQIIWNTPYAKRIYNMDDSSIVRSKSQRPKPKKKGARNIINPNAHSHWAEHAKSEKLDDWKQFAGQLVMSDSVTIQ